MTARCPSNSSIFICYPPESTTRQLLVLLSRNPAVTCSPRRDCASLLPTLSCETPFLPSPRRGNLDMLPVPTWVFCFFLYLRPLGKGERSQFPMGAPPAGRPQGCGLLSRVILFSWDDLPHRSAQGKDPPAVAMRTLVRTSGLDS